MANWWKFLDTCPNPAIQLVARVSCPSLCGQAVSTKEKKQSVPWCCAHWQDKDSLLYQSSKPKLTWLLSTLKQSMPNTHSTQPPNPLSLSLTLSPSFSRSHSLFLSLPVSPSLFLSHAQPDWLWRKGPLFSHNTQLMSLWGCLLSIYEKEGARLRKHALLLSVQITAHSVVWPGTGLCVRLGLAGVRVLFEPGSQLHFKRLCTTTVL